MALATRHGLARRLFLPQAARSSTAAHLPAGGRSRWSHCRGGSGKAQISFQLNPDTPKGCWGYTLPSSTGRSVGGILRETLPSGERPRSPLIKAARPRWAAGAWLRAKEGNAGARTEVRLAETCATTGQRAPGSSLPRRSHASCSHADHAQPCQNCICSPVRI